MLQKIREITGGLAAWIIIILVSIPFALWGIQEYTKVGSQLPVATVDGHEITERELDEQLHYAKSNLRNRLGKNFRPELFDQIKLRQETLEGIIRERLVLNHSNELGLKISDGQVRAMVLTIPAFQKNGIFDHKTYETTLFRQGRSPIKFEEQVRASLVTSQFNQIIATSEFITEQELNEAIKLRQQQRSFKYFIVPAEQFTPTTPISDTKILDYYSAHKQNFEIPEQVKLDYLVLETSKSASAKPPTEAQLQELYKTNIQQYKTPEKRQIRHILVTLNTKATKEEVKIAREKISKTRDRILSGEAFDKVAKEISQDPGSASKGGDLGLVGKGVMVPEFENAAFALPQGKLSDPVRSAFGFHLIEVTKIQAEYVKPFAELREELVTTFNNEALMRDYLRIAEQLSNLIYEHPDSLEPAAKELNLKIQHSDWLSKLGGTGIFANEKIMRAAFSDEVLVQGNNSELIEITEEKQQQAIVVRMAEHRDVSTKPLTEVKTDIATILKQQEARQAAFKQAESLVTKLHAGEDFTKVAGKYSVVVQDLVIRNATVDKLPHEILTQIFKLPVNKPPKVSSIAIQLADGNAAVILLDKVLDGKSADVKEPERKTESRSIAQVQTKAYYDQLLEDMRSNAKVWIAPQNERRTAIE